MDRVKVRKRRTKLEHLTPAEPEGMSTPGLLIRLAKCYSFLKIV